jgi:Putative heavy-metal chelation
LFDWSFEMLDSSAPLPIIPRQPHHALKPEAFALEAAQQWALDRVGSLPLDQFRLTSFWYIDFIIQHTPGERKTRYAARLAQSESYGIAFGLSSALRDTDHALALRDSDHELVGEDSRIILRDARYRNDMDRTALIDLVMAPLSSKSDHHVILDEIRPEKYLLKSRLFVDEAELILQRKGLRAIKGSKPHIVVIGAMAGTISALTARGFDVSATDMSPDVVGRTLGGVSVCGETENSRLIEAADLAIITGMALPNRTLPNILNDAKRHNTSTMMWAVTGRNFGHYYIEQGIDCVVSDPLPFLMLPGPARIDIWRREQ